ncbi:hypothetical protein GGR54DRAFT_170957 [Hypoxylon sp. NC1633]|nr:hypothetical protein GGR54DRAFT_170957 [Hypoxylon sp. NC1633]
MVPSSTLTYVSIAKLTTNYPDSRFEYENRRCKVIRLGYDDRAVRKSENWDVSSDSEWQAWFENEALVSDEARNHTTSILLGSRKESGGGLSHLPFSQPVFEHILERFWVHDSIARTVFRNYAATFSRTHLAVADSSEIATVYNCRSPAHWKDDLALSITYFPRTGQIYAVFYGCNDHSLDKTIMTKIANRFINSSEDTFCHPMLSVGIFAEIERSRMRELVLSEKTALQDNIDALQARGYGAIAESTSHVDPWLNIYSIRNGLECWREILSRMIAHIDELGMRPQNCQLDGGKAFCDAGHRIKDRLVEINLEYLDLVKECNMIIDGMTLATNMALAKDNLSESKQMKAVAIVTMVFLPGTFVATLFSTSILELDSTHVWLYPTVTLPLTILVLGLYVVVVVRPQRKRTMGISDFDTRDQEKGGKARKSLCWV